jgi:hypothetical protein
VEAYRSSWRRLVSLLDLFKWGKDKKVSVANPDFGVTNNPGEEYNVKKPIRVTYHDVKYPVTVCNGDSIQGTFSRFDPATGIEIKETTPPQRVTKTFLVNMACKIEVMDEFGMDVGIGYVWGQKKGTEVETV